MYKNIYNILILLSFFITPLSWAMDTDGDGSDAVEEALAGTSDSDATKRPYWHSTINGQEALVKLGLVVEDLGDVNSDGYADYVVSSSEFYINLSGSGSVKVISGIDGTTIRTIYGDHADDRFGNELDAGGDVNNDGYPDILVGAYYGNNLVPINQTGYVKAFSGLDGTVLHSFYGTTQGEDFGLSANFAGDINNDGYEDIIVGARNADNSGADTGSVFVYSGSDGSLLWQVDGQYTGQGTGEAVSDAGDVNNDGYDDFIIGIPRYSISGGNQQEGLAEVYSGLDGSLLYRYDTDSRSNWFVSAEDWFSQSDQFGYSVDAAGDINLDGYDDVIVGADLEDTSGNVDAGSVRIFSGKDGHPLHTIYGNTFYDRLGHTVKGIGDINGDGRADFAAGSTRYNDYPGFVRIFSGWTGEELYEFVADDTNDDFAYSFSALNDIDGDSKTEFLVTAPEDDNNGSGSGSVRLILSSDLSNDTDLDYVLNANDDFPDDPTEWIDTDMDGKGDNSDEDDDNDGITDTKETLLGTNPLLADSDNDNVSDDIELLTWCTDPNAQDTDSDGQNDDVDVEPDSNATCSMPLNGFYKGITFQQGQ